MHINDMNFPLDLVRKMVRCVEDAVGDDIREDIQSNDLRTMNSVPSRIWDLLNTKLYKTLKAEECTIATAHRGPWQMIIIFEKTTECIFTFMREKRFSELQRKQRSRIHMHYIDMLAAQFNKALLADKQQLTFIPHHFTDEENLAELVQDMLHDLGSDAAIVRNHVLVLFDTIGYQLTHIRAAKVTPNLDIAQGCEQDWSTYITVSESSVVEKVEHPENPANNPNRGLKLKSKATERKKNKPQRRMDKNLDKKES